MGSRSCICNHSIYYRDVAGLGFWSLQIWDALVSKENELGLFEVAYWFPDDVASYGGLFAAFPAFFAWMGAFSEAVGGLFFAFGLKTRFASFLIMCTMLVAIFLQKWGQGSWGMLPAMGFLWVSLYNLYFGSGRFGLDYLISRRWQSAA